MAMYNLIRYPMTSNKSSRVIGRYKTKRGAWIAREIKYKHGEKGRIIIESPTGKTIYQEDVYKKHHHKKHHRRTSRQPTMWKLLDKL